MAFQLNKYLSANNLANKFQNAYKTGHSAESALIRVQNDILCSIDQGKCVILLLLDLSAAFDTVDHQILRDRLANRFEIRGTALAWFNSYLSGQIRQFVCVERSRKSTFTKLSFELQSTSGLCYRSHSIFPVHITTWRRHG